MRSTNSSKTEKNVTAIFAVLSPKGGIHSFNVTLVKTGYTINALYFQLMRL